MTIKIAKKVRVAVLDIADCAWRAGKKPQGSKSNNLAQRSGNRLVCF